MTGDGEARPPIPASCAHRPAPGGLVHPWVNVTLADGGCDYLTPHYARAERCWLEDLCQVGGDPLPGSCVLFGGPAQMAELYFDEPPACPSCAVYVSRACPMVGGRRARYATHARLAEGPRGAQCGIPGCECGGWTETDPAVTGHAGEPAHPYWACYARPGGWQLCGKIVPFRCGDQRCRVIHQRKVITGAFLTAVPAKVLLVSTPGGGRVWRRLSAADIAGLVTRPLYRGRAAS